MTQKNWFSPEAGRYIINQDEAVPMLQGAVAVLTVLSFHVHSQSRTAELLGIAAEVARQAQDSMQ